MRIWSLNPQFLDSKRLVAQWREALLCRAVLEGKTVGYTNHPQFLRVKQHPQPHYFINFYLYTIWEEGKKRGFNFDRTKIVDNLSRIYRDPFIQMEVTDGQLDYEFTHLQHKLGEFTKQYATNQAYFEEEGITANDCFITTFGAVMNFEKQKAYDNI